MISTNELVARRLSLLPNDLVRRPDRTRHGERIGIVSGRCGALKPGTALPCQTREQATATDFNEPLAGAEGSSPFFVEDAKCRQADVADFLFTEDVFVALSSVARYRIQRRRWGCYGCTACQRQRQSGSTQNWYGFAPTLSLGSSRHRDSPETYGPPHPQTAAGYA